MDDVELRRMFGSFSDEVRGEMKSLRGEIKTQGDIALENHDATHKALSEMKSTQDMHGRHIARLWKQVRGSDPPTGGPSQQAATNPPGPALDHQVEELDGAVEDIDKQLSEHDLTIAGIQGQLIAIDAKHTARLDLMQGTLGDQSRAMGLEEKKPKAVRRESIIRQWASLVAAITGLITASVGAYYTLTHAFPPPTPAPAPTAIHAP